MTTNHDETLRDSFLKELKELITKYEDMLPKATDTRNINELMRIYNEDYKVVRLVDVFYECLQFHKYTIDKLDIRKYASLILSSKHFPTKTNKNISYLYVLKELIDCEIKKN